MSEFTPYDARTTQPVTLFTKEGNPVGAPKHHPIRVIDEDPTGGDVKTKIDGTPAAGRLFPDEYEPVAPAGGT